MQIEVHSDPTCFTTLTSEWLELLAQAHTNTVFQTPQFLGTWWDVFGNGDLHLITIRNNSQLVGIAPLYIHESEQGSQVSFVGCVNVSDYLDLIVHTHYSNEVYSVLIQHLKQLKKMSAYLCSLPENSLTLQQLQNSFTSYTETVQDVCPRIILPKSWEVYLESLKRKQRHEIRRKFRRLAEVNHEFKVHQSTDAVTNSIPTFIKLHALSSEDKRDFWDEEHITFFSSVLPALAKQGWVKLFELTVDGNAAAMMLVFDYNTEFQLYNSGFQPELFGSLSVGTVLTAHTIKQAIEQEKTVYDFLRGDEEYKFKFGAEPKEVKDVSLRL